MMLAGHTIAYCVMDPYPQWSRVREDSLIWECQINELPEFLSNDGHRERHVASWSTHREALFDVRRRIKAHRAMRCAWRRAGVCP